MANSKISALTAATTPVAGTETLPIVQSGVTKQVSIANLTAGRAVSAASLTLTTALTVGNGGTGTSTAFTAGSIIFAGASGVYSQKNSNLFFDSTNNRIGLNTASPAYGLDLQNVGGSAAIARVYGNDQANVRLRIENSGGQAYELVGGNPGASNSGLAIYDATAGATRIYLSSAGDVTLNTGNLVQGTAAKGINFTANTGAAGKTSQLLNWYEEGTWTPSQGVGLTVVGTFSSSGTYTRVGRQVTVIANLNATTSITAAAGGIACTGLPFTVSGASVGSLTTNALTQSSSASAYLDRLYSSSATTAATGLIITVTYFV